MKKRLLSLAVAAGLFLPMGFVLAATAPSITIKWVPLVRISTDGTQATALLRIGTDQRTDMSVMICEGTDLSGDIAVCDWKVNSTLKGRHVMKMEDLKPDTTYSYRAQFVNAAGLGVTTEDSFVTMK